MDEMIQRAEESMDMEHCKVVQSLEGTAQSHHYAVVRQKEESYESQLQQKRANANHEPSVLTSNARRHQQHVL
eukprot:4179406-Prorocentrum_lima.AAC.1